MLLTLALAAAVSISAGAQPRKPFTRVAMFAVPITVRHEPVQDENGLDYVGFDAEFMLDWRDFGIAATNEHNSWFQPSRMLVSDSVRVSVSFEGEHRARFDRPTGALTRVAFDSAAMAIRRRPE